MRKINQLPGGAWLAHRGDDAMTKAAYARRDDVAGGVGAQVETELYEEILETADLTRKCHVGH